MRWKAKQEHRGLLLLKPYHHVKNPTVTTHLSGEIEEMRIGRPGQRRRNPTNTNEKQKQPKSLWYEGTKSGVFHQLTCAIKKIHYHKKKNPAMITFLVLLVQPSPLGESGSGSNQEQWEEWMDGENRRREEEEGTRRGGLSLAALPLLLCCGSGLTSGGGFTRWLRFGRFRFICVPTSRLPLPPPPLANWNALALSLSPFYSCHATCTCKKGLLLLIWRLAGSISACTVTNSAVLAMQFGSGLF